LTVLALFDFRLFNFIKSKALNNDDNNDFIDKDVFEEESKIEDLDSGQLTKKPMYLKKIFEKKIGPNNIYLGYGE
jgi:hypothetical protein